ncbi:MAG: hypothetical protein GY953_56925, partial [bacterium]|nr:hypothetical protein [bacterium]
MNTKLTSWTFRLFAASLLAAFPASPAGAVTLLEWDASDWNGSGAWTDTANSEPLTVSAGAVTKAIDSTTFAGSGQQISSTVYDGSSGFNSDGVTPIEGLGEFTISAVIRVGATPGAGATGDGDSWRYAMITGLEIGGAGQGEFQFGF